MPNENMNEQEPLLEVEPEAPVEAPVEEEPPAWEPPKPEPTYVTADQLAAFESRLLDALRPKEEPDWEESLAQKIQANTQQAISQTYDPILKPSVATQVADRIAEGLSPDAKSYVMAQLMKLPSTQHIGGIINDGDAMEMLRNAAENIHRKKTPPSKTMPTTEAKPNVESSVDDELEKEANKIAKAFKIEREDALEMAKGFLGRL